MFGFNGATPMVAWKARRAVTAHSGATSFNGATPMVAWKARSTTEKIRPGRSLQWGHADGGVEGVFSGTPDFLPRHSFNGATPMVAWKAR